MVVEFFRKRWRHWKKNTTKSSAVVTRQLYMSLSRSSQKRVYFLRQILCLGKQPNPLLHFTSLPFAFLQVPPLKAPSVVFFFVVVSCFLFYSSIPPSLVCLCCLSTPRIDVAQPATLHIHSFVLVVTASSCLFHQTSSLPLFPAFGCCFVCCYCFPSSSDHLFFFPPMSATLRGKEKGNTSQHRSRKTHSGNNVKPLHEWGLHKSFDPALSTNYLHNHDNDAASTNELIFRAHPSHLHLVCGWQ